MIDAEVADAVLRAENRRLVESRGSTGVYESDVNSLLEFARNYASLDKASRDELHAVVSGNRSSISSALSTAEGKLRGMNRELDEVINELRTNRP